MLYNHFVFFWAYKYFFLMATRSLALLPLDTLQTLACIQCKQIKPRIVLLYCCDCICCADCVQVNRLCPACGCSVGRSPERQPLTWEEDTTPLLMNHALNRIIESVRVPCTCCGLGIMSLFAEKCHACISYAATATTTAATTTTTIARVPLPLVDADVCSLELDCVDVWSADTVPDVELVGDWASSQASPACAQVPPWY